MVHLSESLHALIRLSRYSPILGRPGGGGVAVVASLGCRHVPANKKPALSRHCRSTGVIPDTATLVDPLVPSDLTGIPQTELVICLLIGADEEIEPQTELVICLIIGADEEIDPGAAVLRGLMINCPGLGVRSVFGLYSSAGNIIHIWRRRQDTGSNLTSNVCWVETLARASLSTYISLLPQVFKRKG